MKFAPALANLAWAASCSPAWIQFRRALAHPAETQLALLRAQLSRHENSAYGRAHGFVKIRSSEEYARRVPLVDYEDLAPWMERIQRGEASVLTDDPVQHLIPTSGSTGARKLIPFTAGLQREFHRALGPWIADLHWQHPKLAWGPAYWSVTPSVRIESDPRSPVPIGFDNDSRYLGGLRQRFVDAVLAAPSALRLVADVETFRYLTLLCLLRRRDLRLISVWHPSFLTLLVEGLPRFWDELLNDLQTGRCGRAANCPAPVREVLPTHALPGRAAELRHLDPRRPETIWPFLKLISCWGDGHAEAAAGELARQFPNTFIQPKGLLATEAFVTIPFARLHPVSIRSHFFEFLDDRNRIRLAHQLHEGESYDVVVTTSGGLWRYRLRDRVAVNGFVARTPSFRFLGKSNQVSDRFGEKLSEAFVAQAIREITAALGVSPRFALLAPEEEEAGWRYTLFIEGAVSPELAARLDGALRQNPHYAWCRDLGQLQMVRVVRLAAGGYETFVSREMNHGRLLGEIKPTSLSAQAAWSQYFQRHTESGLNPAAAASIPPASD